MPSAPVSSVFRSILAQLVPTNAALVAALALVASLGVAPPLAAAPFTVDVVTDAHDETAGDGFCDVGTGDCTLRAAIEEAQALAGADTIGFASGINGAPITLTLGALPQISTELAITGNGEANTIVQASTCNPITLPGACTPAEQRVLATNAAADVQLARLTIRHGRCSGDCDFSSGAGGGIYNGGRLSLQAVTISSNQAALGDGGGIHNAQGTIVSIRDSTISGNRSINNGGGISNYDPDGSIGSIVRTVFVENQALYGAGLYAGITGVVAHSIFEGNIATNYGGGIYADGDLGLVTDCTFDGNSAGLQGGGLYTDVQNSIGLITRSVFVGNSSQYGGGLREYDGSMGRITNSTFSGNTATVRGGAIDTDTGTISAILNVTITGNSAPLGSGIYTGAAIPIVSSIFGANGAGDNCAGTFIDALGNRSDDSTCDGGGAIVPGTDYSLALADNGGNTATHALLAGSPAIDDIGACGVGIVVDQRGAPRDDDCDLGAFEAVNAYLFADGFETPVDWLWSACTGCDVDQPAEIDDLAAEPGTEEGTVDLTWTAPTEDTAGGGAATAYELRSSEVGIETHAQWLDATAFPVVFTPGSPGFAEQLTVNGLTPGVLYYFVVRAVDDGKNQGPIGPSASAQATSN